MNSLKRRISLCTALASLLAGFGGRVFAMDETPMPYQPPKSKEGPTTDVRTKGDKKGTLEIVKEAISKNPLLSVALATALGGVLVEVGNVIYRVTVKDNNGDLQVEPVNPANI